VANNGELLNNDPLWYKDAIIYQVHLKSFYDSNDDGIGDFQGLMQKLDYLEGLGITAIWMLPFYPSPLRDDGYDIADYFKINPDYGTLRDFKKFLKEAHKRGIRVITELVINHTSNEHPWFKRARKSPPGSVYRDYYVWSDTPDKYQDTRIIFKDFETSNWTYDPVANAYFWHRFYSHQPDLNFDNPKVQKEIFKVVDFWAEMGVDGFRLDAIPYLYEREGTNCENLPESHAFLKKLRKHVESKYKCRMFLAEANQWPEDAAAYFGDGDECHMAFHFPVMPRLFMAMRMEDRFPVIDILEQTPGIPDTCQWAMFLRNHDELTLEMVTDEERDYMYNVFAKDPRARINLGIRRRLAPLIDNNRRKIELMNILLFSLPGTPVVYYGDEIGMGDNYYLGDRDGVRTPMQWSSDRNAGFSGANPQKLYLPVIIDPEYNYEAINVETQEANLSSLLWWMKRVIAMRKRFKAFSRGTLEFVDTENPKVLTFIREFEDESILVVINLSRFSQVTDLDLREYAGYVPEEVFSHNRFPEIRENAPYLLTLGPYGHYWFVLNKQKESAEIHGEGALPEISMNGDWTAVLKGSLKAQLETNALTSYVSRARWFGGKAKKMQKLAIETAIPIPKESPIAYLLILSVEYATAASESYLLPVAFATGENASELQQNAPGGLIAKLNGTKNGLLYDGVHNEKLRQQILQMIDKKKKIKGPWGELMAHRGKTFRSLLDDKPEALESKVLKVEQSNSSFLYEDTFFLKLYRRIEEGINPDLEVVKFLTENKGFQHAPPFAGSIELKRPDSEASTFALLQGFIPNEADAWTITLDALGRYFDRVLSRKKELENTKPKLPSDFQVDFAHIPPMLQELIGGPNLEHAAMLGQRTAQMHLSLSDDSDDPSFQPEAFSKLYQRSLYQSMRSEALRGLQFLSRNKRNLSEDLSASADEILDSKHQIIEHFQLLTKKKISAMKIRTHGDYHLGQVLFTGKDFIIIDFEGEPARRTGERRLKYPCFRDVAGMLRSYHYASYNAFFQATDSRPEDTEILRDWVKPWYQYVSGVFLNSYLKTIGDSEIIPKEKGEIQILLETFLISKAIYELIYELNNRPTWAVIPIEGIRSVIGEWESVQA